MPHPSGAGNGVGGRAALHRLDLGEGVARVSVGNLELRVAEIVTQEPGVAIGFLSGQHVSC